MMPLLQYVQYWITDALADATSDWLLKLVLEGWLPSNQCCFVSTGQQFFLDTVTTLLHVLSNWSLPEEVVYIKLCNV